MTRYSVDDAAEDDVQQAGERAAGREERRRRARASTSLKAMIQTRQSEQLVTIENLSELGLGLAGIEVIEAGDDVIVALDDGRTLAGKTVWREEDRGGIVFSEPLISGETLDSDRS